MSLLNCMPISVPNFDVIQGNSPLRAHCVGSRQDIRWDSSHFAWGKMVSDFVRKENPAFKVETCSVLQDT